MIVLYIAISFVILFLFATLIDFDLYKAIFVPAVIIGLLFSISQKLNTLINQSKDEVVEADTTENIEKD
ncbi:hypothetical protein CIB95_11445 [Lottiidibacillus patelloidae]|uniref:Uncharacterized protein n=1 Tax=Lottiidibacillus patelloidae TaxID=2670334 RepID=A0A263BRP4_9BACI|nr:hypothetical protein [Lottiidibacillus patelloidae]OZM56383.1 hypothetical protein CIB95_11445 [Lottiidibacillus patelloidae]